MRLLGTENFEQAKDGIFNDTSTTTNDSNSKRKDRSRSSSLSRLSKGIRQRTNPRRRRGRSHDPFNSNSNSNDNINSTYVDAFVQQQQQQQQYQTEQELDEQQRQARITLGRSRSCSVGSQKQHKKQHNENRRKFRSLSRSKDKTNKSKESNGKNNSTRSNSSRSRSNTKSKSKSQRKNGNTSNIKRIRDLQLKIQQHSAAGSTSTFNVNDVDTEIESAKQKVREAEMGTKSLKEKRLQYNAMKEEKLECNINTRSNQKNQKLISAAFSRAEELQRHQLHKAKEKLEEQKGLARMMEHHMWYEYYLKPFSMVVQKNDLFSNKDLTESQQDNNEAEAAVEASYIMLPTTTTGSGCCGRVVKAICALCMDVYKEGDIVVWNPFLQQQHRQSLSHSKRGNGCLHVFHKNCLIKWLVTKGKHHCPICQQWYVPGQKIEDQQKLHGQSWIRALNEMKMMELVDNWFLE
mmetsp:Transcript_41530/g.46940  ORF Transcript_41530/g.46940 Transcript_41530/m.46940 type:complete len:463 (+) Transcript_41530:150-1538(+)